MSETRDDFAFENFPRQPLPDNVARADLLSAILTRMEAGSHQSQGRQVLSLSALGALPDDRLALLVPVIVQNADITIRQGFVVGKPGHSRQSYRLFPLGSPALTAFNLINGANTLEQISKRLAEQTGWEQPHSFAYVRGLFLALVVAGLSHPREP